MLRSEPRLDPAIREELDALDAALRRDGGPREASPEGADATLDALAADVRAARPALDADARARLEERAGEFRAARGRSGTERAGRRRRLVVALAAVVAVAVPVGGLALSSMSRDKTVGVAVSGTAGDTVVEQQALEAPAPGSREGSSAAGTTPSAGGATSTGSGASSAGGTSSGSGGSSTGAAASPGPRRVVRAVRQTVRVAPDGVARAAARVGETVEDAGGYVADSSVRERGRSAGGRFEIVVPTGRLNATVAALGRVGTPVRLDRSSVDVTARATTLDDRLADARADRSALRLQLARTVDADRRAARRRELRLLSSRVARLQAERDELRGQTSTARIVLRLTTADVAPVPPSVDDGRWGLDDAWRDATRVLEVTAGVVLVGAIVLLPVGLALAGVALLRRRAAAARRERVIDAS